MAGLEPAISLNGMQMPVYTDGRRIPGLNPWTWAGHDGEAIVAGCGGGA